MPAVRIKDQWREQRLFDQRSLVCAAIMGLGVLGLIVRLFVLQVARHEYYSDLSQGNRVRNEPIPAARGLILDRNGEVIAGNQPAYQLEMVPEEVADLEDTLARLVQLELVRSEDVGELERTVESSRSFDSVPIRLRMSDEDVARFAVRRFEFQGLDIKTRQTRWYPNGELAVHALGYVGAISEQDLKHIDRAAYAGTALSGTYPPGSTYKPVIALAALTYHVVDPLSHRYCAGAFHLPRSAHVFREYHNEHHGSVDLDDAIARSCDVYFYGLADVLGVDRISAFMAPFGFGKAAGIDIGGEKPGILPSREWKAKMFSRPADQVWFPGETVNFGIGQGYLNVTPLQLAHYASIIATRGKIWKPRLVAAYRDPRTGQIHKVPPQSDGEVTGVAPEDWQRVVHGMIGVTTRGTAAAIGYRAPYTFGGKTGTAQVFTVGQNEKYNASKISERLRDHSWFIAFAPADEPRIALAVLQENGGAGASAAAPIARKVLDAYLLGADGKLKPQQLTKPPQLMEPQR